MSWFETDGPGDGAEGDRGAVSLASAAGRFTGTACIPGSDGCGSSRCGATRARSESARPNLRFDPRCWCPGCTRIVDDRQIWKLPRRSGCIRTFIHSAEVMLAPTCGTRGCDAGPDSNSTRHRLERRRAGRHQAFRVVDAIASGA
jgi:hypothetical protein